MMKTKLINYLLFFSCCISWAQMKDYQYKRTLTGVTNGWHQIQLPEELFSKISPTFHDLRIYGINKNNDTIEAPYLLKASSEKRISKQIPFTILNTSNTATGYYVTFEMTSDESINQLNLSFAEDNFDWLCALEGSQNQQEWFTITENKRIVSIKNNQTDFQFTQLTFGNSKYRFYRLYINSKEKPQLKEASISKQAISNANYTNYPIKKLQIQENKANKQTELSIELPQLVPVSFLKINVLASFDYYRSCSIQYLSDSIQTEKGWIYQYQTLTTGTLNSMDTNGFSFRSTLAKKLKIIIDNQDNQPLKTDSIQVKGYQYQMLTRINEPASYYLVYGNSTAFKPEYDIHRFVDQLPTNLTALSVGDEQIIQKNEQEITKPLFQNVVFLWIVMGLIITVLGWFSFTMLQKK